VPIAAVVEKAYPSIDVDKKRGSRRRVMSAFETRNALPSRPFVDGKLPALKFATSSDIFVMVGTGHVSPSDSLTDAYRKRL